MQIHENCHQNKNNIEDGPLIQMLIETSCSDQLESRPAGGSPGELFLILPPPSLASLSQSC